MARKTQSPSTRAIAAEQLPALADVASPLRDRTRALFGTAELIEVFG
jgi:hypothetical protein